ncbi:hypothetical protein Amet_0219 [Alkaliphilus metalliredigens QYMF]|uniref:HTH arsR-type domain-containing protein n=1 Tax=Alkaliphilus metalliredigens (strain QYMF) TaxID=293826 RepID=A6TJT6_ALKMQ|nr:hypothetical protein Amet_0219 [Alkaliphilus metalliredigens QYMF]
MSLIVETGDFVNVEIYIEMPESYSNLTEQEKITILYMKDNDGKVTTKEVMKILDIKDRRGRKILKDMVDKRLINVRGQGRSTYYVLKH